MLSTLKAVPQKEGYLGLYKGNGAMMVRIFPYGAIQFMAFDNYKKVQSSFVAQSSLLAFSPFLCSCICFFFFCNFASVKVPMKVCSLFLLRNTLDLSLLLLQLLSKQIGISGHIHRLVAGSMAGKVVVATDKTSHSVPAGFFTITRL